MRPLVHNRQWGAETLGGVRNVSEMSVLAWILVWAFGMAVLLYLYVHVGPWLQERREFKKLHAWLHKLERGEVDEDG